MADLVLQLPQFHNISITTFEYTPDFGYAATVSYVILIIIAILSLIQFRFSGDRYE